MQKDIMPKSNFKVGVYMRIANESQHGHEMDLQRMVINQYLKEQRYSNIKVYADEGYSGLDLDRPAFMQLDADIKQGDIDIVITRDMSRIARDYLLAGKWLLGLKEHGTQLITTDGYCTTADVYTGMEMINAVAGKQTAKRGKY